MPIDGFKGQIKDLKLEQWTKHSLLKFPLLIDEDTAEILKRTRIAANNGLQYRISPSEKGGYYFTVNGSLHKYFNEGLHNFNNFKTSQLNNVIDSLKDKFYINPENTDLFKLEIGFNIELPIKVTEFLDYLISTPNKRFVELNTDNQGIGKICTRTEYDIKVYDKGEQIKSKNKSLLRIELRIKKRRYLNKLGIFTLADLKNPVKISVLANLLYTMFEDIIFYERNIDESKLTTSQLIYLLRHKDAFFWEGKENLGNGTNLTKQNRYSHKKTFEKFLQKHSEPFIKDFVLSEIKRKTNELIDTWHLNNVNEKRFTPFTFSRYKWSVKRSTPHKKIKAGTEKKVCMVCGVDISHKNTHSKYCSVKCKNKANNKHRTKASQEKRQKELQELSVLKNILPDNNYNLLIVKRIDNKIIKSRKKQKDIKPLKYRALRKIIKVKVYVDGKTYELNTLRAKALIKEIYQLNYKNAKKHNCIECNKEFLPNRKDAKYCSRKCKNTATNRTRDLKRKSVQLQV